MRLRLHAALLGAALVAAAGCNNVDPITYRTPPGFQSMTGSWKRNLPGGATGTYSDVALQLSEDANGALTGTWTATLSGCTAATGCTADGTVQGVRNRSGVGIQLVASSTDGYGGSINATLFSANQISGTLDASRGGSALGGAQATFIR